MTKGSVIAVSLLIAMVFRPTLSESIESPLDSARAISNIAAANLEAGSTGSLLPPEAAFSSLLFSGIRPGTWMVTPNWCTLNFVFNETGSMGKAPYYIGTARHCVQRQTPMDPASGSLGDFVEEDVIGKPVVAAISTKPGSRPLIVTIGKVAKATSKSHVGSDFALIEIDKSLEHLISPSMNEVGGPTKEYVGLEHEIVESVGHSLGLGTGGTSRIGLMTAYSSKNQYGYGMLIGAGLGDSGAPVRTAAGAAVGNLTHVGLSGEYQNSNAFGTRVSLVRNLWNLRVVTCSSLMPWMYPGCPDS